MAGIHPAGRLGSVANVFNVIQSLPIARRALVPERPGFLWHAF
jgi:hypothetical protein